MRLFRVAFPGHCGGGVCLFSRVRRAELHVVHAIGWVAVWSMRGRRRQDVLRLVPRWWRSMFQGDL